MKGKCWHWGDLAGWWTSKPWLTWLRQRLSKGTALSKATLHSHLECSLLFPCPETCSITHASPSPHSFLSSHVFLKEEPCPVLVETGCCYYYLQEKQKILILSAAQRKQWVRRREVETTPQCCHPLQPLQIPKVWEPCALSAGRETQRWGWDTVPGRTKTEPTTCSRICRQHCLCNPGLSQAVLPRLEISIWMNHGFPHIKKKKGKMFPIPQVSNFSHTMLMWFQLQGRCAVGYSPVQIQVNCFLSHGQEEQCSQGCLQHPQGQRHLPRQTTEWELPATLPVPQHTPLSRE